MWRLYLRCRASGKVEPLSSGRSGKSYCCEAQNRSKACHELRCAKPALDKGVTINLPFFVSTVVLFSELLVSALRLKWCLISLISLLLSGAFLYNIPGLLRIRQLGQSKSFVSVQIVRTVEAKLGKQHSYYLHFSYQSQEKSARVSRSFAEQVQALKTTKLFHLPQYPDLFLPPDYDFRGELISHIALIMLFLFTLGYSVKMIFMTENQR
jgi:hypothetical protein